MTRLRGMRRVLVGALIAVVLAAGVGWYVLAGAQALPARRTDVIIPRGLTFAQIIVRLQRSRVVGSALPLRLLARLRGVEDEVRAGEYRFAPHLSAAQVLSALLHGGAQTAAWVTIPEGFTAKQIAARLAADGIGSAQAYEAAFMRDTLVVDGTRTKNLEGFLFPDTYLIPLGASPREVVRILTSQFFKELPRHAGRLAARLGYSVPQVVTVASLIEREAKVESERSIMAGVYYNRLRIGMPLQVDATIEYALAHHASVVTLHDLRINSPYNTYEHLGLPPTPIANPGRESLEAAFHPAKTPYLYYVYKGHGRHAFARTLAQQNANVAKYLK
ncbi:MAG: endolytic transglycosylase MltG [Vulcanimicrobiaceae bacterium]